ncbi:hypothetical protein K814_0129030 [Pseudomonas fluorescens LMG 5329]|uniref:Uncharacterized protein n=1 Tax=Pseudomonas fluorescens LMG 5329 TaxID=1324332 RepID=A0A0A1YVH5_PSEFL|nr:hypothetical protein K814_0129030 [Pseudomonas fluorescens LMG 5329]
MIIPSRDIDLLMNTTYTNNISFTHKLAYGRHRRHHNHQLAFGAPQKTLKIFPLEGALTYDRREIKVTSFYKRLDIN